MATVICIGENPWLRSRKIDDRVVRYWADPPEPIHPTSEDEHPIEQAEDWNFKIKKALMPKPEV